MVNRVLDAVAASVGPQQQNQFALLLTTLGAWIEHQSDPGKWLKLALDTLGQHRAVDDERN